MSTLTELGAQQRARHRYLDDPTYHALVHTLSRLIVDHGYTEEALVQAIQIALVRAEMVRYDRGEVGK